MVMQCNAFEEVTWGFDDRGKEKGRMRGTIVVKAGVMAGMRLLLKILWWSIEVSEQDMVRTRCLNTLDFHSLRMWRR